VISTAKELPYLFRREQQNQENTGKRLARTTREMTMPIADRLMIWATGALVTFATTLALADTLGF
jgi:hypothetical protein